MSFQRCLCVSIMLLGVFYGVSGLPSGPVCHINSVSENGEGERRVSVVCGSDEVVELHMSDQEHLSEFSAWVVRKDLEAVKLLGVEYHQLQQDMFVEIDGTKFSVKNEATKTEESTKLRALYNDPSFRHFPAAVKLIHDELELKGWESPAVMFLYRMAMAMESVVPTFSLKREYLTKRKVDEQTYAYHGGEKSKECSYNGWAVENMDALVENNCRGICGQSCQACWTWVCGDCCLHHGCKRHDEFCSGPLGYLNNDCLSARGVLWDTQTDTPMDC